MRILSPPAALYAGIMALRAEAYARKVLGSWRPPCPCISVGNIRWGGTGKTPVCAWLMDWASSRGMRPVVLTRGYRANPPVLPYLVPFDAPPAQAGDEPLLLARSNPAAHVVVDPRRARSGNWAWQRFHPDLFLLDDGFQHLSVLRDINLVLFLPRDLEQDWNRVVPSGPWREGSGALRRADAFLLKVTDLATEPTALRPQVVKRLRAFGKPVFIFAPFARGLTNLQTGARVSCLPGNTDQSYMLVSGVGNPVSVDHTATTFLGTAPRRHDVFADHHAFSRQDITRIHQKAQAAGAENVVCTAKDAVKIREILPRPSPVPWWSLETGIQFALQEDNSPCFEKWLDRRLEIVQRSLPGRGG